MGECSVGECSHGVNVWVVGERSVRACALSTCTMRVRLEYVYDARCNTCTVHPARGNDAIGKGGGRGWGGERQKG